MDDLKRYNNGSENENLKENREILKDLPTVANCPENVTTEGKESKAFTNSNTTSAQMAPRLIESSKIIFKTSNTWKFFK